MEKILIRILLFVFTLSVLLCGIVFNVNAATTRFEGGKPVTANTPFIVSKGADLSDGGALVINSPLAAGTEFTIEYTYDCAEEGYYTLDAVTTYAVAKYTSPYSLKINGEAPMEAQKATQVSKVSSATFKDLLAKYNFEPFWLNKGKNQIRFIVNKNREIDNLGIFYMDYFEIKNVVWGPKKFISKAAGGVFEKDNQVAFNLEFTYPDTKPHTYNINVTDFWGSFVMKKEVTVSANSKAVPISFGKFEKGWYKIVLSDKDKNNELLDSTFCVVTPLSTRPDIETPFAFDTALSWLAPKESWNDYAKVIRLAGAKWVRERYTWGDTEAKNDIFNYSRYDDIVTILSNEGINISDVFHDTAPWAKNKFGNLPANLFDAYDFMKTTADHFGDKVDAWEIWNENDAAAFSPDPPDLYASFFKTCAIALADTKPKPIKSIGGFTVGYSTSTYPGVALQNDIMKYADVFNNHRYGRFEPLETIRFPELKPVDQYRNNIYYNKERKPIWMTESGIYVPSSTTVEPNMNDLRTQANYLIVSIVDSLAYGTNKHYWFVLPYYKEGAFNHGVYRKGGTPNPCYESYAVLTEVLRAGKFTGTIKNIPAEVSGRMFDSGVGDVAVLWSDSPKKVTLRANKNARIVDMMGSERVVAPSENGIIELVVSYNPVYVCFDEASSEENYEKVYNYSTQLSQPSRSFEPIERVVLMPIFEDLANNQAKYQGYKLNRDVGNKVEVEVYNFNKTEMSGVIIPQIDEGWTIEPAQNEVKVAPFEKAKATFTVRATDQIKGGKQYSIQFVGEFNNQKTSPTVSLIAIKESLKIEPSRIFEETNSASNWHVNLTPGGTSEIVDWPQEKAVTFKNKFNAGDRWTYPSFVTKNTADWDKMTGITLELYSEEDIKDEEVRILLYQSNGSTYYTKENLQLKAGWNRQYVPWSAFSNLYNSNDMSPAQPSTTLRAEIGLNAHKDVIPPYSVRNVGLYYNPDSEFPGVDGKNPITIEGIENNQTIDDGILNFKVTIPKEAVVEKTRIVLGERDLKYTIENGQIIVNETDLPKGEYNLYVVAYTFMGKAIPNWLNVHIK